MIPPFSLIGKLDHTWVSQDQEGKWPVLDFDEDAGVCFEKNLEGLD